MTPLWLYNAVEFLASGATPGMLEPGESEQIPVYYAGWLSSQWSSSPPVTFSLAEVDSTDTDDVDWPTVLPGLQLGSINDAAWSPSARSWPEHGLDLGPIRPDARQ